MVRIYSSYLAMQIFARLGLMTIAADFVLELRFCISSSAPTTRDLHVQPLILAAILTLAGFQMLLTGIVADLINSTRSLVEDVSYRCRRLELSLPKECDPALAEGGGTKTSDL